MIETGQKAPELNINDQNGTLRTIAEFKGKKLVLYFYPKDDTPGCAAEACDLRDNYSRFLSEGYAILGVSPDTEAKHQKFIAKYELPFDLLADTEHTVAIAFGVWVEKSMYGKQYMGIARKTFIINENGLIETVIDKVNTKAHTAQIL
jgi:peroxiredoxin Q/BCP